MHYALAFVLSALGLLAVQDPNSVTGRWIFSADFYGTPIIYKLELQQQGDKLTGEFGGDKLEGTRNGNSLHFLAKDPNSGWEDVKATIQGDTMTGTAVFADNDDPVHRQTTHSFTAK